MLTVSCDIHAGRPFPVRAQLQLADGVLCLFGPSGAGKSTLLSAIAGFLPLHDGEIRWSGRLLADSRRQTPPWRRRFSYVEQRDNLFDHLSVRQNILYGAVGGRRRAVKDIVDMLDLADHLDKRPSALSGGQRQRVALARALAADPVLLLLDEPFSALDAAVHGQLIDTLRSFVRDRRLPTMLISHQFTDVQRFGDVVTVMDKGAIVQSGAPAEVFARPATRRVAELIGYRRFLRSTNDVDLAVHPDRILLGKLPELGPVYDGCVARTYPCEGRICALVELDSGEVIEAALRETNLITGGRVSVTLIDPPRVPRAASGH